ncbi:MAG TPA: 5-(carboxyamino)imidazole ribonucleotide synthase, partial [Planctomycetaceae bacterium]|nr:5-(carboxyamino)imidazole ribonucleotide synthase [Planctomycetaceae bacterium]
WATGEPDWAAALDRDDVKLHLYGKSSARPGRKMGHLTAMAEDRRDAARKVLEARALLIRSG